MDSMRRHWMTFGALLCFALAAALMITSLSSGRLYGALDMLEAPVELAATVQLP